jgi:hypothetical protein
VQIFKKCHGNSVHCHPNSWGKQDNRQLVARHIRKGVQFPGETMILSVEGKNSAFARKFRWMRDSRIA